jgi:hypothetical protein
MPSLISLLSLSLVAVAVGTANTAEHKPGHAVGLHAKATAKHETPQVFKHRLRVCNAYPYDGAVDVFRGNEKLTKLPLEYKMCGDFASQLMAGDKLKFKVGDDSAGTFTISDLPNNDAVLLLVIQRHDTLSTAVAFKSHVFANLLNAQVAVIDAFKGRARGTAEIHDGSQRREKLKYNSVVATNPGEYKVELVDGAGKVAVIEDLVALNRESYVIIRTGVDSQNGPGFAQDLIVYPMSDPALLHSAAPCTAVPTAMLMVLLSVFSLRQ